MAELILEAQKALDENNLEAYKRLQKVIRDKYLEEEGLLNEL